MLGLSSKVGLWLSAGALGLAALGCSNEVTGPSPSITTPAEGRAIDPGIACRAQITTDIVVNGTDFSPVTVGLPKHPRVALPTLTLSHAEELDGSAADGSTVTFSGDAATPTNLGLLSWQSQNQMTFEVTQDVALPAGGAGEIPVGVYGVSVENPNTHAASDAGALAIVDKPELSGIDPSTSILCLAQGDRQLTLKGTTFLGIGDKSATLAVDGVSDPFPVDSLSDCTDIAEDGLGARYCAGATLTLPQGSIDSGYPALTVHNPDTAACHSEETVNLRVVPPPTIDKVVPSIACDAQDARSFDIQGKDFLVIDGSNPSVTIGGKSFAVDKASGCDALDALGHTVQRCTTLSITVAEGALDPGTPEVSVTNPDPAGCSASNTVALTIVPPPSIAHVKPALGCDAQGARKFTIEGSDFLTIDGADPDVTLDGKSFTVDKADGCEALTVDGHDVQRCTSLEITVAKAALDPGTPEVVVTNPDPAGCSDSNTGVLVIAPPPTVTQVAPPLVCVADSDRSLDVLGSDFLTVDGVVPSVTFDGTSIDPKNVSASDCHALKVDGLKVESCTKLSLTVPQGALAAGNPSVTVTNPDPAGCSDSEADLLAVVTGPAITAAVPALVCTDDAARDIVLTGTGFLQVGNDLPVVKLNGTTVTTSSISGCKTLSVNGLDVKRCTSLTVSAPKGSLAPGQTEVSVQNPAPAGCAGVSTTVLTVPPTLALTSAAPSSLCQGSGAQAVVVHGTGLLRVGSGNFSVSVNGQPQTPTAVSGCQALDVSGLSVETCTSFTVQVDATAASIGAVPIAVTNPDPSNCSASSSTILYVAGPPQISSVAPSEICSDQTKTITIDGSGFAPSATVMANAVPATQVTVNGAGTQIQATFATGLPAGTYDVSVQNAVSCATTKAAALTVDPAPIVFFVDPPVIYAGTDIQATIFTSNLTADASKVELVDANGVATNIPNFTSPQRPNKILAPLPASLGLTAGDYTIRVTSNLGCASITGAKLKVTDTTTLDLAAVDPAYVSPTQPTAVTITANNPPGSGKVAFEATPRAYLSPVSGGTARGLRAVVYQNAGRITAVVPDGMTPDDYDLIVVNPSGAVGVLADAVHVTTSEPPVILSVTPNSFDTSGSHTATISGANFATDGAGVDVSLSCKAGGVTSSFGATVNGAPTSTSVQVTLPTNSITAGAVCLVTLKNKTAGSSFTYSAISVRNPSANLNPWAAAGSSMVEARRALQLVAGRPTTTSRFLYAIGGDDGTVANAKTSVEGVSVDGFGALGSWALQRHALPNARTQASSARIGRFVYVTGGHDGTSAVNTVYRSQILDPLAGPEVTDLNAVLDSGSAGLDAGLWYYLVAATFPSSDVNNPAGESLPGEPFPVELPSSTRKIDLSITWAPVTGASGYRVYRSPSKDATLDQIQLLATVTCGDKVCVCGTDIQCAYSDDGQTATQAGQVPLPQGSLGTWRSMSTLVTPREGHASVAMQKPGDPSTFFLYAFGGRDASGTYLDSYEWAQVSIAGDGSQTLSTWTNGNKTIGTAKAELGAWVVTNTDTSIIGANSAYVFLGTGRTNATTSTGELVSGSISNTSTDGQLAAAGAALDSENSLAGQGQTASGVGAGGGRLYLFGGERGNQQLISTDSSGLVSSGPNLPTTWDSLGSGSLLTRRSFPGSAQESAFFFIAGGRTASLGATTSVEQTVE